jgi:hypothetical protein
LAINQSTDDTLYVAFAVAMRARGAVVADGPLGKDMRRHPDPVLATILTPLADCARRERLT